MSNITYHPEIKARWIGNYAIEISLNGQVFVIKKDDLLEALGLLPVEIQPEYSIEEN